MSQGKKRRRLSTPVGEYYNGGPWGPLGARPKPTGSRSHWAGKNPFHITDGLRRAWSKYHTQQMEERARLREQEEPARVHEDGWGDVRPPPERPDRGRNSQPPNRIPKVRLPKPGDMLAADSMYLFEDRYYLDGYDWRVPETDRKYIDTIEAGASSHERDRLSCRSFIYLGMNAELEEAHQGKIFSLFGDGRQWWCKYEVLRNFRKTSRYDRASHEE